MIILGKIAGLRKDHSSDREYIGELDWRHLAQVVACECIMTIQLGMPRNGRNSVENQQSKKHIDAIARKFGITMPVDVRNLEFDDA